MGSLLDGANNGSPQSLGDVAQAAKAGAALALHQATLFVTVPASQVIVLPDNQKAKEILEALDASDGSTANLTLRPDGDFDTTEAADTEMEIVYRPWEGAVVELRLTTIGGNALMPDSARGVLLIRASTEGGSVTGPKTVVARTATPDTTEAALTGDGTAVEFLPADVVNGGIAIITVLARASLAARLQEDFFGQ